MPLAIISCSTGVMHCEWKWEFKELCNYFYWYNTSKDKTLTDKFSGEIFICQIPCIGQPPYAKRPWTCLGPWSSGQGDTWWTWKRMLMYNVSWLHWASMHPHSSKVVLSHVTHCHVWCPLTERKSTILLNRITSIVSLIMVCEAGCPGLVFLKDILSACCDEEISVSDNWICSFINS